MEAYTVVCRACSREAHFDGPVPRRATCTDCGIDLRCCLHCRHWDASAYNECSESAADRVVDKESSNFCDWFQSGSTGSSGKSESGAPAADALEKLFSK